MGGGQFILRIINYIHVVLFLNILSLMLILSLIYYPSYFPTPFTPLSFF
jgi:hypothetical protein